MIRGVLIAESLRSGTTLENLNLVVREIRRVQLQDNAPHQPDKWTLLEFEASETDAERLSESLAAALDEPGWYVDFHSDTDSYVVFPGRVFCYRRGDPRGRSEAEAHARTLGIPEHQLDWTS